MLHKWLAVFVSNALLFAERLSGVSDSGLSTGATEMLSPHHCKEVSLLGQSSPCARVVVSCYRNDTVGHSRCHERMRRPSEESFLETMTLVLTTERQIRITLIYSIAGKKGRKSWVKASGVWTHIQFLSLGWKLHGLKHFPFSWSFCILLHLSLPAQETLKGGERLQGTPL